MLGFFKDFCDWEDSLRAESPLFPPLKTHSCEMLKGMFDLLDENNADAADMKRAIVEVVETLELPLRIFET